MSLCVSPLRTASSSPIALHLFWIWFMLLFKARYYRDSSSQCSLSGLGSWCGAWTPCPSGATSAAVVSLPFVNCHTVGVGPDQTKSLPLLPILTLLLYILSYGNSVQLIFRWFPTVIVLFWCVHGRRWVQDLTLPSWPCFCMTCHVSIWY